MKTVIKCVKYFLKLFCYIVFWGISIYFAYLDKTPQMVAYLLAGFLALILFNVKILQPYVDAISFERFSIKFKKAKELVQDLKMF